MLGRKVALVLAVTGALVACNQKKAPEPAPATSASASTVAAKPSGVTFTKKTPSVGQKVEESDDTSMSMTVNADPTGSGKPQKSETSNDETVKYTEEVLGLSNGVVNKVKATFATDDEKSKTNGKETKKPSAIAGKSYVVEAKDGKLTVTDDKGKPVPAAEAKEVESHFASLGKPEPVLAAIPATPLEPGQKVDALAKAIGDELATDSDGMKVSDVSVTFKEKSGDDGVFDVAMKTTKEDGAMTLTSNLKGKMKVSTKTGQPTSMDLEGPISVGTKPDPKSKAKYDGSGKLTMKMEQKSL